MELSQRGSLMAAEPLSAAAIESPNPFSGEYQCRRRSPSPSTLGRCSGWSNAMADVRIGTSGWHYGSWRGPFYPPGVTLKNQLRFYSTQFLSAELNGVFYRTPTCEAVQGWREQTPDDFVFAWKASKFITHWKRLSERCDNSLALLEHRLSLLGDKVGPVLFQLPPQFERNDARLEGFLKMLNRRRRYAFEFRHPGWYAPRVLRLL